MNDQEIKMQLLSIFQNLPRAQDAYHWIVKDAENGILDAKPAPAQNAGHSDGFPYDNRP